MADKKDTENPKELNNINELSNELTTNEIEKLKLYMKVPGGLCEDKCNGASFLSAMRNWKKFNPYIFFQALKSIKRIDLLETACKVPWLCVTKPTIQTELSIEELSIETFFGLLRTAITQKEWKQIASTIFDSFESEMEFDAIITELLTKKIITKDLKKLKDLLITSKRFDVSDKLEQYKALFIEMEEEEFISKMTNVLVTQAKEISEWDRKLKQYLNLQFRNVTQMLGDDEPVDLESVYIELTILKQRPPAVSFEDETTFNEITQLRKIANKEIEISPIDFTADLREYIPDNPEIWCLIGNPGCGKTFISMRVGLEFSKNRVKNIRFSISVPCRTPKWHSLETTRLEEEKVVTHEYVQEWLCLGLPVSLDWTKDLAKHLSKSDGEGLLLIIDGLDEFPKKIQFEKTLLYLLLTREILCQSTIILTTRPGAWTDISSRYLLKVDRYYQVLGFSPDNRDLYFQKQLANEDKLNKCKSLLEKYDEMNHLSLIPVNASLFAALMKDESVTISTLTQLYSELTCYLIRRQLTRMGLKRFAEVTKLESFNPCVLDCLHSIGLIALQGVGVRELNSTERVTITVDHVEIESYCLGLVHEYYKRESVGIITKVWAFAHLTMQEFTSAIFLSSTTWTDQCISVRYMANSDEGLSLFRMVIRFLCGLLSERSAAVLTILYKLLTRHTIQDIPMYNLLRYDCDESSELLSYTGWHEFTKEYLLLNLILFETNSISIRNCFKRILPDSISIYLDSKVLPVPSNEWNCFLQSLQLVNHIQLIHINTSDMELTQFKSLLKEMRNYPLSYLALKFENESSTSTRILTCMDLITKTELSIHTKVSIELTSCQLSDQTATNLVPPNINNNIGGLKLIDNECSNQHLQEISNLFPGLHYLCFEICESDYNTLLPALSQATQLRGLYLTNIPRNYEKQCIQSLPPFSELKEISFQYYSVLPHIVHLTGIRYLALMNQVTIDTTLSDNLLQLISKNEQTLRALKLQDLDDISFTSLSSFLTPLQACINLVQLEISNFSMQSDGSGWGTTIKKLQSLIHLTFDDVRLSDVGFFSVCQGLVYHPALKYLCSLDCELTSNSCEALAYLIPTVSQLEKLSVNNLSEPDPEPIRMLEQTAKDYSISAYFFSTSSLLV